MKKLIDWLFPYALKFIKWIILKFIPWTMYNPVKFKIISDIWSSFLLVLCIHAWFHVPAKHWYIYGACIAIWSIMSSLIAKLMPRLGQWIVLKIMRYREKKQQ